LIDFGRARHMFSFDKARLGPISGSNEPVIVSSRY
jgi:hypothetical protein